MMKQETLFIPVVLGTVRKGRRSEAIARWLLDRLAKKKGIETKLIDPRDMDLPMDDEGPSLAERNPDYVQTIEAADGLLIVSPEYNSSYPGSLKRMMDILKPEYARRAVAVCGVSTGVFGGARMMEHMHALMHKYGMPQSPIDLYVPNVKESVDEDGSISVDDEFVERADMFLDELVWLATALNWGRRQVVDE